MANVLTDLAADIYKAADVVSRELVGFIPSVIINGSGSERVALNGVVRSHFTRQATAVDNVPSMAVPEGDDQTVDNKTLSITKSKGVQIPWTGEDIRHVDNGAGFQTIYGDQIAQAMRSLANEMETDLAVECYLNASRGYGTPGTTPFDTPGDYTDMSETLRILKDNGAPNVDNTLVMDTAAGARFIGKQADASRQGSDSILRQGVLLDVAGNRLRESAQVQLHAAGTGSGYESDGTAYPVGATQITLATGTGTILAGDSISFAGDSEKYQVVTGITAPGQITIAAPGLRQALPASAVAVTVSGSYTANVLLNRTAAEIAVRAPAKPSDGDAAVDSMIVMDPRSGIPFDVSVYKGFQKAMINVSAAWGVKAWKPEHIALLYG